MFQNLFALFSSQLLAFVLLCVPSLSLASSLYQHKNDQPIEVTSDVLEVDQLNQKAIFTGKVVAIQGDITMKADKMIVLYEGDKKENTPPVQAKKEGSMTKIRQITANGNVTMHSPGKKAEGQRGIYKIEENMLWLWEDVVLIQGSNIVKGEKLTYNLATGSAVVSSSSNKGKTPSGKKPRVKGVFIPKNQ